MSEQYSIIMSGFEGTIDGVAIGSDPLGAIYSHNSGRRTIGGLGIDGGVIHPKERPSDVNYESMFYRGGRVLGASAAGIVQLLTYGTLQGLTILCDLNLGNESKKSELK